MVDYCVLCQSNGALLATITTRKLEVNTLAGPRSADAAKRIEGLPSSGQRIFIPDHDGLAPSLHFLV